MIWSIHALPSVVDAAAADSKSMSGQMSPTSEPVVFERSACYAPESCCSSTEIDPDREAISRPSPLGEMKSSCRPINQLHRD
jgi:hypothetical protein